MAKVFRCRLIPKRFCLNFFGIILSRDTSWISPRVLRHEAIHSAQQRELLWIPFYLLYILEWIWQLLLTRNWYKAYESISFEREAYANESDEGYLKRRPVYAQWRHSQPPR